MASGKFPIPTMLTYSKRALGHLKKKCNGTSGYEHRMVAFAYFSHKLGQEIKYFWKLNILSPLRINVFTQEAFDNCTANESLGCSY